MSAAGGRLELSFWARDVYLVMAADAPVPASVEVSGIGGATATEDVAADGSLTVGSARLYHLVHLDGSGPWPGHDHFRRPGRPRLRLHFRELGRLSASLRAQPCGRPRDVRLDHWRPPSPPV